MHHLKKTCKGFSLLEVIVCLLLLGIVSAIWGMGLAQVVDGFMLSAQNRETSQKIQTCMLRLTKEFQSLASLSTPLSANTVSYIRSTAGMDEMYTVFFDAGSGVITVNEDILTDGVKDFVLHYYDTHDAAAPLSAPVPPDRVRLIGFQLAVKGAGDTVCAYEALVFLRGLSK
ncbi:MAG: prepilin-type N-terminal cleavage/methylation domain-containing protein [Desulfobacterales bacterium]